MYTRMYLRLYAVSSHEESQSGFEVDARQLQAQVRRQNKDEPEGPDTNVTSLGAPFIFIAMSPYRITNIEVKRACRYALFSWTSKVSI